MPPSSSKFWTTDSEYIALFSFIIEKTEHLESPMSIRQIAKDYKEKNGAVRTVKCLSQRIERMRKMIDGFDHIDTDTKVKISFALSAPINPDFLKKLKKNAVVEIDVKKRITYYKTNDGSIELRGDHSHSAKLKTAQCESKRSYSKLIRDYFENKNDVGKVPKTKEEKEMKALIEFVTEKCHNVNTPLNIQQLATDFNYRFGISIPLGTSVSRVKGYCRAIQKGEFLNTHTKVQQLFGLSATINLDYLKELRKDALIETDERNRITYYKANNGSLELRGDHSHSAKNRTAKFESKQSLRSLIIGYFKNKTDVAAVPESEKEEEMENFLDFITEKCENVNSPLSIFQLANEFNNHFEISRSFYCIYRRIRRYCREIQKTEFLDTHSKVKQLFGLGGRLDSDCLRELRKDAVVEVDDLNKITKYTANNGRLTLHGDHSRSAKRKLYLIGRRKKGNAAKKHSNSVDDEDEESDNEEDHSEDDSDEYSSEEFSSEFDSDDENDDQDKSEDHTESSHESDDFDNETLVRNCSPTEISVHDNFDFDPPTERSHTPEEIKMREDEETENDPEITETTSVKTRSGRLSKRRHLDSDISYNLVNSRSSATPKSSDSTSSRPAKQKKISVKEKEAACSSNQSRSSSRRSSRNASFSSISSESAENMENQEAPEVERNPSEYHGPSIQEMEDYDYHPREDNLPESSPIDNSLQEQEPPAVEEPNLNNESQNTDNRADAVASEPKPEKESLQNNKNATTPTNEKSRIKVEQEDVIIIENPTEEVKPKTSHNSKIKFFEAMKSLILFLDTPSLSDLQSKIHQKIRNIKGSEEVFQNNELILGLEFMIVKITNHSSNNLPKSVESVSLSHFLCHLKAAILNSKLSGLDSLLEKVKELNKQPDLQLKTVPVKTLAIVLQTTMDNIGF